LPDHLDLATIPVRVQVVIDRRRLADDESGPQVGELMLRMRKAGAVG